MMKTGFIFLPTLQGISLFKGLPKEIVLQSNSDLCLLLCSCQGMYTLKSDKDYW